MAFRSDAYPFGSLVRWFDMVDSSDKALSALTATVQGSWHRFLDVYEPLLPLPHAYALGRRGSGAGHAGAGVRHARQLIARLRYYFFTEDVLAEVCRELDVPFRRNGYRFW